MPMTTDLPVGDLFEFIGDFRLNGDGPPTTGRMGLDRLQAIFLGSTSLVGARIAVIESRLATAESFTNQITGLASRVTALEALAGISPGTDLAADGTAVRSTRYWPRPGEAIRTWTAQITATALAAAPLTVGGIYSISTDGPGKGPALRITGTGYATSIAKTHLDDGEIVEFTFRIARRADNTGTNAATNNIPVLEFRCYKADGTDNGTAGLPSTALLAADGLRTVTYRACLTPGVGSVDLPANTRFISPLFGERGNGAIELTSADRNTQSLANAPEMADAIAPEDRLFIFDDSAKLIKKYSFAQLEAYLAPRTVPNWPKVFGQTKSSVISLEDPERRNVMFQAPEGADMAIGFNYKEATFDPGTKETTPSAILFDGDAAEYGDVGAGVISIALRPAAGKTVSLPAPVFCRIDRLSVGFPTGTTFGDDVMARWPDDVHPVVRNQMRASLNSLYTKGVLDADGKGAVKFFMRATGSAKNDRINLANPDGKRVTYVPGSTGIINDAAGFIQGGGVNAFGNTGLLVDELGFALDSQFMMLQPFDATIDANGIGMGDSSILYLTANVTASRAVARSGPNLRNLVSQAGKSAALNRISASQFETFSAGTFDAVTDSTIATMPSGPLNIMATYASSTGFTSASPLKWRYFMAGRSLGSRATIAAIETEMVAINAAFSQINGGV